MAHPCYRSLTDVSLKTVAVGVIKSVAKTEKSGGKVTKVHTHIHKNSFPASATVLLLTLHQGRPEGHWQEVEGRVTLRLKARGVYGGRWYNMTGHYTSGILASWFILALSSLHYCHTFLLVPLASSITTYMRQRSYESRRRSAKTTFLTLESKMKKREGSLP